MCLFIRYGLTFNGNRQTANRIVQPAGVTLSKMSFSANRVQWECNGGLHHLHMFCDSLSLNTYLQCCVSVRTDHKIEQGH